MRKLLAFLLLLSVPAFGETGTNQLSVSYTDTSGNTDTRTLSVSYTFEKDYQSLRLYSDGSYLYKTDSGEETANKLTLNGRIEKNLSEKILFYLSSFLYSDPFSGYDYRVGLGPGIGYQLIDRENESLKLFSGFNYTYSNYTGGTVDSYSLWEVKLEYKNRLLENLLFCQKLSYQISLENSDDYFVHTETSFQVPVTENIALGLSYVLDYQNLLPDDAEYHTDKTFLTSIIYRF
jgi:putative salt-induced outer membrane protein